MQNSLKQKILLITPPFVQLNTPYPATAFLKGTFNKFGIRCEQADLGIEVLLKLFSSNTLKTIFKAAREDCVEPSEKVQRILQLEQEYLNTIDPAISFLQMQNPTLAHRICTRDYLPEGSRFEYADNLELAFGEMGIQDKAKYLATLYLEDLNDLIVACLDPLFGFSRYAERIASAAAAFDEMEASLISENSLVDSVLLELLQEKVEDTKPDVVGFSVPFPGNLYAALKCGQWLKQHHPSIRTVMGGGYPNTELRALKDPRVFQYVDFITLDDGEQPLLNLLEHLEGKRPLQKLKRTFAVHQGEVKYFNGSEDPDLPQSKTGIPDYSGLPLKQYLSVIETVNPMHRLWSDGRWNKLMLAHGCYWGRCTFCDTSLDYIGRFEPSTAAAICDKIAAMVEQTGESGFHFVDEAAPPALLKSLALELIRRKMNITWWTNIRFEKNFTADLCLLMKKSGCVAVSGGLEVASDRVLSMINKGVSIDQVSKVMQYFKDADIFVHAYLMYGFPTQTAQETIDSLEIVRQLFVADLMQSGFWHHFAMTVHSPVGLDPSKFGVENGTKHPGTFANNEVACIDQQGANHAEFGEGLRKSLFNFMHGIGLDFPLSEWFDFKVPKTGEPANRIRKILQSREPERPSPSRNIVWLGGLPDKKTIRKNKKGSTFENVLLTFYLNKGNHQISLDKASGEWLFNLLERSAINSKKTIRFEAAEAEYEGLTGEPFLLFWNNKKLQQLRKLGLLLL